MALTTAFFEAVKSNDIRSVRIMMKDSLLIDPTFCEFSEMEKVASDMEGLFDAHDGRQFNNDRTSWNDEYMNKVKVQLVYNFSHERLNHLMEVIRYLRPVTQISEDDAKTNNANLENDASKEKKLTYQEMKARDKKKGNCREVKILTGAAVGAVIGGTAAAVTSASVISGVVVGAAVGGTVVTIATIGDK